MLGAPRSGVHAPHERLRRQHQPRGGTGLAAADAPAGQAQPPHLGEEVLPQVGHVQPTRDVLDGNVAYDPIESYPRMHARLDLHEQVEHLLGRVRNERALFKPPLDDGPWHHLRRVHFPLVRLQVRIRQHVLKHDAVELRARPGQVGHQVDVHFVARVLQPAERRRHLRRGAAAVDPLEHRIVSVLHPELQPRAAVPPQPAQLGDVDGVRPGLEREADDLALCHLVEGLLLEQRQSRALGALPKGVCRIKQVAHKLLLVLVRVRGPGAAEHQQLDLVDGVAVHRQRGRAIRQLHHRVEVVLVGALDRRLVVQVRLWLVRLRRAIVAVPRAREGLLDALAARLGVLGVR
mmetsp:Transcript_12406/g.40719  ORF Transcript_12406/g.40719 Transcript_12406/m.40719 type:complete len:348 (-) Transcript_12406:468-1511(-)